MTSAPDAPADAAGDDWQLGDDNLARNTLRVLRAAGITVTRAERMTRAELGAVPGLGPRRQQRVLENLERRKKPSAATPPGAASAGLEGPAETHRVR